MQNGSGTFDLLPGITYTGRSKDWSWGGQFNAIVRLGENDDNYTLGNVYSASVWGARRWVDWLSSSARLIGEVGEDIDGADPRLNPLQVPTADPNLRAGNFLSLGLGLNFLVPSGPVEGVRLSVEGIIPLVQDLDGPQTAMHQESTPPGLVVTCSETPPRKPYSARRATVRWQRIFPRANAIPPEA